MANITLNVDDEVFNKIVEQELDNIPSEKLQEIIIDAMKGYFSANNYEKAKLLVYTKESYGYRQEVPTDFAESLIRECDYSKLQEVVDAAIEDLKTNHERLLREILMETLATGLINNYSFQTGLREAITNELCRRTNNQ